MRVAVFLFCLFSCRLCGQPLSEDKNTHLCGLALRIFDRIPLEGSYIHHSPKGLPFTSRTGIAKLLTTKYANTIYMSTPGNWQVSNGSGFSSLSIEQTVVYVKPGIIFFRNNQPHRLLFLAINIPLAFSHNELNIQSSDLLYGSYLRTTTEITFHKAAELEVSWLYHLTRHIGIDLSAYSGYKIFRPEPFSSIVEGIGKTTSYDPSQGYGEAFYVNLSLSILFRFEARRKKMASIE